MFLCYASVNFTGNIFPYSMDRSGSLRKKWIANSGVLSFVVNTVQLILGLLVENSDLPNGAGAAPEGVSDLDALIEGVCSVDWYH